MKVGVVSWLCTGHWDGMGSCFVTEGIRALACWLCVYRLGRLFHMENPLDVEVADKLEVLLCK